MCVLNKCADKCEHHFNKLVQKNIGKHRYACIFKERFTRKIVVEFKTENLKLLFLLII